MLILSFGISCWPLSDIAAGVTGFLVRPVRVILEQMKVARVTDSQCDHSFAILDRDKGHLSSRDPLKANRTFQKLIAT